MEIEDNNEPTPQSQLSTESMDPRRLGGMYRNWFLDYASYVILERAVPRIDDGLKPVQRRILHAMKQLDDGRFNKVANIVGHTMQYHPHGDASIYEALVQLGQKEMLVDTQGNWGNILTGASAAAGRYIEARLSQFALDVVFNPKITEWTPSYDGRKDEPVVFPVKFPLLLAQGVEGIAVGLSSKILPHNFCELLDACVSYLKGEPFELYPDFPTGGFVDVSRYNDGERGGSVKIRAKIEKVDPKTLAITEIPYGKTTAAVIDSILKAFEAGKIKIRKVDDNTAHSARILVYLQPGTSSDKTIDALYAFTDCEVSVSPNCCVIVGDKPQFLSVSQILRHNVETSLSVMRRELEIQLHEVSEQLHFASLEKIFIEKRIYKDKAYEESPDKESAVAHIASRLVKFRKFFIRDITEDDIVRLFDIKMGRILKFNADKCDQQILAYQDKIATLNHHLTHLREYAIDWYEKLKAKYGEGHERLTQLRNFDNIQAATVAEVNEKLYINREEGFIGTGLKKDEFLFPCSAMDDVIIFYRDGKYRVVRVMEKLFVGKNIMHIGIYRRGDTRTVYNAIYQNGRSGPYMKKRFSVPGITRDKDYDLTQGLPGSRVTWFSANSNGEAEVVKVTLKPRPRLKSILLDVDFSTLAIKGRGSAGNLVTKNPVLRFSLKERGVSTLGGLKVWFDPDVLRLNYDGRGSLLGEFFPGDLILVVMENGEFFTTNFDLSNHYPDKIRLIQKLDTSKIWTALLYDATQEGKPYIKRFKFEPSPKPRRFLSDSDKSQLILLSDEEGLRIKLTFGGGDAWREPVEITARDFIAVKGFAAKGKRLTTFQLEQVTELEPQELAEEPSEMPEEATSEPQQGDKDSPEDEIIDEITGQQRLF